MISEQPEVSRLANGRLWRGNLIGRRIDFAIPLDQQVDLGRFETCDRQVEVEFQAVQMLKFQSKEFPVPAGILGQPVVGDDLERSSVPRSSGQNGSSAPA